MKPERKRATRSKRSRLTKCEKKVIFDKFIEDATELRDVLYDACTDLSDEKWTRASSAFAYISVRSNQLAADCISLAISTREVSR